jgi:hypothetical protein
MVAFFLPRKKKVVLLANVTQRGVGGGIQDVTRAAGKLKRSLFPNNP